MVTVSGELGLGLLAGRGVVSARAAPSSRPGSTGFGGGKVVEPACERQRVGRVETSWRAVGRLVVAHYILGISAGRHWIRCARKHLISMFLDVPGQLGYGKRLRAQAGLIPEVVTDPARDVGPWHDLLRLVDSSTPLPCGASRETVKHPDPATAPDIAGSSGNVRVYLICTPEGMPIIWGLAPATSGSATSPDVLLERDHRVISTGQGVIIDGKGCAGRSGRDLRQCLPRCAPSPIVGTSRHASGRFPATGNGSRRYFTMVSKGRLTLEDHAGRALAGVCPRRCWVPDHGRTLVTQHSTLFRAPKEACGELSAA